MSTRSSVDLGPRPALTIGVWFGVSFGLCFLLYAIFGASAWSDRTLAAVPVNLAIALGLCFFAVAGILFAGLELGWFEGSTTTSTTRRTRRRTRRKS